jgi:hypothetical protein
VTIRLESTKLKHSAPLATGTILKTYNWQAISSLAAQLPEKPRSLLFQSQSADSDDFISLATNLIP